MTNLMHFEIVSLAPALPHVKDGTVRPLAVFTDTRVPELSDVPTIAEAESAEAAYLPWYGIYLPSQGAAKSGRPASPPDIRHPGQADVAEGFSGADEERHREADGGDQGVRHRAAVRSRRD
jgi:hypothetical protein